MIRVHKHFVLLPCYLTMCPACADARTYIADPSHVDVPVSELLSARHAADHASRYRDDQTRDMVLQDDVQSGHDTVYFCVVDGVLLRPFPKWSCSFFVL